MGASGWTYFVPYESDISKALQQLREDEFQQGDYSKPAQFYNSLLDSEIGQDLPPEVREAFVAEVEQMASQAPPSSIEELLEMNAESGTHSILDIKDVSSEPDFEVVAPLTSEQLMGMFGTEKPTRSMVEEKLLEIQSLRSRWQGTYIVLYKDDFPAEILFVGFSGD